jgi:biotin transport system substrate-specific component
VTIGLPGIDRLPSIDRARAGERGITIGDLLVPLRISDRIGVRARHVALILAGTLLIALGARVLLVIPGTPVPVTGQTFGVLVAVGASVLLYVLLGAIGLPLFAFGQTGLDVILGTSGGYLVGFVLAGAIVGRLAELGWDRNLVGSVGAMLLGEVAIYAIGVPWLAVVAHLSPGVAITEGLTPFLAGDALKMMLAAAVFPAAWWLVGRRPGDR